MKVKAIYNEDCLVGRSGCDVGRKLDKITQKATGYGWLPFM